MLTIDENFKINVGVRLKQLRENKHYTINKLLEIMQNDYYVEIDEKSIRRYEKGEFLPKIDNLICLAENI